MVQVKKAARMMMPDPCQNMVITLTTSKTPAPANPAVNVTGQGKRGSNRRRKNTMI